MGNDVSTAAGVVGAAGSVAGAVLAGLDSRREFPKLDQNIHSLSNKFMEFWIYSCVLIGIRVKPENSMKVKIFDDKITPPTVLYLWR